MSYEKFSDSELAGVLRNDAVCRHPTNSMTVRAAAADRIESLALKLDELKSAMRKHLEDAAHHGGRR